MLAARKMIDETVYTTQANVRANLKVYTNDRQSKKLKKKQALKINIMVCAGALLLMCLVYTSLGAKITTVGYEITQLKQQIATAENANNRLMLEVEELSAPEKIAAFAETQMGMQQPTEANIIYQNFSGVSPDNVTLASAGSLTSITPGQGNVSVEVLEAEASHPVLDVVDSLLGKLTGESKQAAGVVAEK